MIKIQKSATADTRTCDYTKVTREQLEASSVQHIGDVVQGMEFFRNLMQCAAREHDFDKITELDWFLKDFHTGFKETGWYDNHRKINRHHLVAEDGVPEDVNLIDVLEYIVDCVMAGMGRSGKVTPLEIKSEVLQRAFENTWKLLAESVEVVE